MPVSVLICCLILLAKLLYMYMFLYADFWSSLFILKLPFRSQLINFLIKIF